MFSRREFLVGSGTLITMRLVNQFHAFIENHGEPFLKLPKKPSDILYVFPERNYQFGLNGDPEELLEYPDMTLLEYLVQKEGCKRPKTEDDFSELALNWGFCPEELEEQLPRDWWEGQSERSGPHADAFHLLDKLDIGSELKVGGKIVGGLNFIDGPSPGNSSLGVEADDDISVSLLQHRLNQLDTGIAVKVAWEVE